jgi:small-conductance mechanosensitive channel
MSSEGFFRRPVLFAVALLLCLPAAYAEPWAALTPVQQEALAPLAKKWDTLPEKDTPSAKGQRYYLNLAKHYPKLSEVQKQRLHERLERWSNLTPEQRKRAREKHAAISKISQDKRELLKQKLRERDAAKAAASGVAPASAAK